LTLTAPKAANPILGLVPSLPNLNILSAPAAPTTQKPQTQAPTPAPKAANPVQALAQSLTNNLNLPSVSSHTCSSTDSQTVQGVINVANADATALASLTNNIATTLTSHVQSSCAANANAVVNVGAVTPTANGLLQVPYTCSGVSDHTTCQNALQTAAKSPVIQQTLGLCPILSSIESAASQKAAPVQAAPPSTQKPPSQASSAAAPVAGNSVVTTFGKKMSILILGILSYRIQIQ